MNHKFKVGDIVNAKCYAIEFLRKPIQSISDDLYQVDGELFIYRELTLLNDTQFEPWQDGETLTVSKSGTKELANVQAAITANHAIMEMML